jgi:hypothetical protein
MLNGQEFLVYVSYKSQLKAYSKQYFDPNCRRERIQFQLPGHDAFLTTVGKLNFFRWAIETNILEYIHNNIDAIQDERMECTHEGGSRRSGTESSYSSYASTISAASSETAPTQATASRNTTRRRRTKQVPAASTHLQRHDIEIRVSFD